MVSHKFWSPKKIAIAVTLRDEGYTYRDIAKRIGDGATFSAVRKLCLKFGVEHGVKHGVDVMDWPGNSPDLNPIENLWQRLKILVAKEKPSNKTKLIEAIIKSWFHIITAQELAKLVESMPRRCRAVIKSKGYATKY